MRAGKLKATRVTVVESVELAGHQEGCGCAETPRMFDERSEDGPFDAWEASRAAESEKYVVLDRSGKKVFGPSTDYAKAKASAASHGTSVRFLTTASEMFDGASEAPSGGACTPVIRDGIVERTCKPNGSVRLAGPKDVWKILKERSDRLGVEQFLCLGSSIQDEMVGEPVLVTMGQVSGVRTDVSQVLIAMLALRASSATTLYCAHNHPSSTNFEASPQDKELSRRIKKGFDAALPEAKWGGHIVCSTAGFSVA